MVSVFFDALKKLSEAGLSEIAITPNRCIDVHWAERKVCSICLDACPTDAIQIDRSVEIAWSKCIKCGICAALCPTEVFEVTAHSDNIILNKISEASKDGKILVECNFVDDRFRGREKHRRQNGRKITVSCIGRFSETFILKSLLLTEGRVEFAECTADCVFKEGRAAVEEIGKRVQNILNVLTTPKQSVKDPSSTVELTADRRKLFKSMGLQAAELLLPVSIGRSGRPASVNRVPARRRELIAIAERHGVSNGVMSRDGMPFGDVKVDPEGCTLCGDCASACPTTALEFFDDSRGKRLTFTYGLCVGCKVCVYACEKGVVSIGESIDLGLLTSPSKTLAEKAFQLCSSCGKHFVAKSESSSICPSCVERWSVIEGYAKEASEPKAE